MQEPSLKLVQEEVDIYQLPPPEVVAEWITRTGEITIGDVHANNLYLLHLFLRFGIVSGINQAEYQELVAIYQLGYHEFATKGQQNRDRFNEILKNENVKWRNTLKVRLLGDEKFDRGKSDGEMDIVLRLAYDNGVLSTINASNHTEEYIYACEKNTFSSGSGRPSARAVILEDLHAQSAVMGLDLELQYGITTVEEVLDNYEIIYLSCLELISYTLDEENRILTIFSHAGIGIKEIIHLAKKFYEKFDQTHEGLTFLEILNMIQTKFHEHVIAKTVHTLYDKGKLNKFYYSKKLSCEEAPVEFILWNRNYAGLQRPAQLDDFSIDGYEDIQWAKGLEGYTINWVHGHDKSEISRENIYNLDTLLGAGKTQNKGKISVLYSQATQLGLELTRQKEAIVEILSLPTDFYAFSGNPHESTLSITCDLNPHQQMLKLYNRFNQIIPITLSDDGKTIEIAKSPGLGHCGVHPANRGQELAVTFPNDDIRNEFMCFLGLDTNLENAKHNYENANYAIWSNFPGKLYLTANFFPNCPQQNANSTTSSMFSSIGKKISAALTSNEKPTTASLTQSYTEKFRPEALSFQDYLFEIDLKANPRIITFSCRSPDHPNQIRAIFSFFNELEPGLLILSKDGKKITFKQSIGTTGTYSKTEEDTIVFGNLGSRNTFMRFVGLDPDTENRAFNMVNYGYRAWNIDDNKLSLYPRFFEISNQLELAPNQEVKLSQ